MLDGVLSVRAGDQCARVPADDSFRIPALQFGALCVFRRHGRRDQCGDGPDRLNP